MLFAIWSIGDRETDAIRARNRVEHLKFVIDHRAMMKFGGAHFDESSNAMTGMLMVIEVENRAAAADFVAAEPYSKAGAFSQIIIEPFVIRVPESTPGYLEDELAVELGQYAMPINPI